MIIFEIAKYLIEDYDFGLALAAAAYTLSLLLMLLAFVSGKRSWDRI